VQYRRAGKTKIIQQQHYISALDEVYRHIDAVSPSDKMGGQRSK
jgi:hypothetical protein